MSQPRVLILRAPGTNCDQETAHAFELAGGRPERLHVNRLLESGGYWPIFKFSVCQADSVMATTSAPAASSAAKFSIG